MDTPANLEMGEHYATFQPAGKVSFEEAVTLASVAIAFCGEKRIPRLLIDARNLTGFAVPGTFERFHMGESFAAAAKAGLKVVLVVSPEMIDPERFGLTVARNRGLNGNVFSTAEEAITWLLAP
jgi:hypothetical protein